MAKKIIIGVVIAVAVITAIAAVVCFVCKKDCKCCEEDFFEE